MKSAYKIGSCQDVKPCKFQCYIVFRHYISLLF